MKTFYFSPFLLAGALVAVLTGCATTASTPSGEIKGPMTMGSMGKEGCPCCSVHKEGVHPGMTEKPLGMMQDKPSSAQAQMCMSSKDAGTKGSCGCCDMGKMEADGSTCCDMHKKEMSPEMHKQHMETMKEKMTPSTSK